MEQSFHRVPGTVKEQITLFDKNISMEAVKRAAVLTGLDETIMQMEHGYDTECTPELFSQGQWQLLSIARAAAADPELLLLDEITANLDAETEPGRLKGTETGIRRPHGHFHISPHDGRTGKNYFHIVR